MRTFHKKQIHLRVLKVGDVMVDVNNCDSTIIGYGPGVIERIDEEFFYVKFQNRKFPVLYNQYLFRHDTAGLKGSRRTYKLDEFIKNFNLGNFNESYLSKELLFETLNMQTQLIKL